MLGCSEIPIFADLEMAWDEDDTILALGGQITDRWSATWATTSSQDLIEAEAFFVAYVDLDNEDIVDAVIEGGSEGWLAGAVEGNVDIALALLRLRGPDDDLSWASAIVCSMDGPSATRVHWMVLLRRLAPEAAEPLRDDLYEIDFEATDSSPCRSLNREDLDFDDPDFVACNAVAQSNFACQSNKGAFGSALCAAAAAVALYACWTGPTPWCLSLIGVAALCDACMFNELIAASADFRNAKNCCCAALACRTDGGSQCPSAEGCNPAGCPGVDCLP